MPTLGAANPQVTLTGPAMILALPGAQRHCHICHFRAILSRDSLDKDSCGHAKEGMQLCSKPSAWEGGNSTEEKEQAECSVLACVGMCRKPVLCGGEGNTCVFLWVLKGLPERQGGHTSP